MIRQMSEADYQRVAEIHIFAQRTTYRGIFSDKWLFADSTVVSRLKDIENWFDTPMAHGVVYEQDGIIKGFAIMSNHEVDGYEIERIFVDPFMQGCGIGRALLVYCEDYGVKQGFKAACLWILEENYEARRFYEINGYKSSDKREYFADANVWQVMYIKDVKK